MERRGRARRKTEVVHVGTPLEEASSSDLGRRRFLKILTVGGGAVFSTALFGRLGLETVEALLSSGPVEKQKSPLERRRDWVMVIDLSRCDGCGVCTAACREAHFVPQGQEWIKVFTVEEEELGVKYFLPRPCMHCENSPCVSVCPVGATYVREDGVVLIDHRRCIGCRYCMAACPYAARYFNWGDVKQSGDALSYQYSPEYPVPHRRGTVEKCVFCAHRADEGKLPACVEACPMRAIFFGDRGEDAVSNPHETWKLSEVLEKRHAFRLKEELGTRPRVFYLPAIKG